MVNTSQLTSVARVAIQEPKAPNVIHATGSRYEGVLLVHVILWHQLSSMVESERNSQSHLDNLHQNGPPDCLPCKIIGASACFGASFYLLLKRNTFGQNTASKAGITVVAAGNVL